MNTFKHARGAHRFQSMAAGTLLAALLVPVAALAHGGPGLEIGRGALAWTLAERTNLPHGVAVDERRVFVTEPLQGRVAVLNRLTGEEVGELPAPPGGFLLPFGLRMEEAGKLVVLDSGGFPTPTALAIPRVYVYTFNPRGHGAFAATLVKSVFVFAPIIFSEELEVIGPDRYVISDSGFGALWVVEPDGSFRPGIAPATLNPSDTIPALGPCLFPPEGVLVGDVTLTLAGNFAPGVGALGTDGTHLYMSATCQGGVRRVPISVLDDARAPHERAASIQEVFARPAGEAGTLKGLVFSPDRRDRSLYALEPFNLRVVRINVQTGQRTVLLDNPQLFDFPVAAAFVPRIPLGGVLVVASDQEQRFAAINASLTQDAFEPPFRIAQAVILPHR